ncbi:MAG: transcriptional regulator [Acidobacteria bacterium]|nr:MAG: transcriptional regulator [Acidobacteriota bacterium]
MQLVPKVKPLLDPDFLPAVLWNRAFKQQVAAEPDRQPLVIALERPNGTVSSMKTEILPHTSDKNRQLNLRYTERLVKFLLWMKGGYRIFLAGCPDLAKSLQSIYAPAGERAFDVDLVGKKIYGRPLEVVDCALEEAPQTRELQVPLGGYTNGCRIGFDLGGSDRKCAALVNGELIFSEEIPWDPYFQSNPAWHKAGIRETLKRCAEKMPRVDCIGGSAAGVYIDNQVRVASLFRGVSEQDFETHVRNLFLELEDEWGVPFVVVNDGEVTALAGSMSLKDNAVLGLSMGTSQAVGYVDRSGHITQWLNELAFAPIDYRTNAPMDEWSGDRGCGVQYLSQQAVARLAPAAGIKMSSDMPFPEQLVKVQKLMDAGDRRAYWIYLTIGTYFGYAIAHYAEFYHIENLLVLGRVLSGTGGDLILSQAEVVLNYEFPQLAESISIQTADEKLKRHGQAAAAATLCNLDKKS